MAEDPESGGEKSEDASGRKLGKAREEGQVAKSMEIASVFVLLAGVVSLFASSQHFYENLSLIFHQNFKFETIPLLGINELVDLLAYHIRLVVINPQTPAVLFFST